MCVTVCLSVFVHVYQEENGTCGTIWGAGESHAGCSLASALTEFNPDPSSPHSSLCPLIMGWLIMALHSVWALQRGWGEYEMK